MTTHPSIETLRDLVARDREFFNAQSKRLTEIQQSDPNTLSDVDKNALSNWDKSVVTDYNRRLLLLEEIEQPSPEERAIMQELNKLIVLGDHIMEKRNLVHAELNDRLNAVKKSKPAKPTPVSNEKAESVIKPPQEPSEVIDETLNTATTGPSADAVPDKTNTQSTGAQPSPVSHEGHSDSLELEIIQDSKTINPKILYDTLMVEPDASLNEIKKATRKAILRLHPDRNPHDPNAASRFADFQVACKVFETEEKRREFDDTGDVKDIDALQARLEGLAME